MKNWTIFRWRNIEALLVIAVTSVIICGCAYNGARANKTVIKIEPERISTPKLDRGVNVAVSANSWHGEPKSLKRYITPFYIEIQNKTDKNIIISETDYVLFDELRNQFNPLPPGRVANIIKSAQKKYARKKRRKQMNKSLV